MQTVLIIEDDPTMLIGLKDNFEFKGYKVITAADGERGLKAALNVKPDLIILDIMLPKINGYEICRLIREEKLAMPIIMLTAKGDESDIVLGLNLGADDYVTKPFGIEELLARIRATLRRMPLSPEAGPPRITIDNVEIDFQTRKAIVRGNEVRLTPKEFELLRYLVLHPNKAIPHRELLQAVWGPDYGEQVEYLRVFVKQLRRKIEPHPEKPRYILTEPWVGYRFNLPEQSSPDANK